MQFNDVITFSGGINTDDDSRVVPKGDYRDFSYCRLGTNSEHGLAVVTSLGTLQFDRNELPYSDKVIGVVPWLKKDAFVFFVYKNDGDHEIRMYENATQTITVILTSPVLNFSRDYPILHANIVDDILKWTDGRWDDQMYSSFTAPFPNSTRLFNPPYQINLQKALDGFYTSYDLQTFDAIKWPMDPPVVTYFTDITRNDNKLRNKLFKFIIQPIYENGEEGVWSMYSSLQLPEESELVTGTNWIYTNNSNGIRIQFFTGPKSIRKFNIAVQQLDKDSGTNPPFGTFLQLDKEQDSINDNQFYSVDFFGGVATSPAIDVFKNYDRLPIVAECQEYLPTNQLTYVNFREGYNKPSIASEFLDVSVNYELNEISWIPNSDLRINFTVNDLFLVSYQGFLTITGLTTTSQLNSFFKFLAGTVYTITVPGYGTFSYTISDYNIQQALAAGSVSLQNQYIANLLGDAFSADLGVPFGQFVNFNSSGNWGYYWLTGPFAFRGSPLPGFTVPEEFSSPKTKSTLVTPSLKTGATHEFGIVYGDRAYRDGTVYTVDSMNLFVPWFYDINRAPLSNDDNPFTVNARFSINHIPPVWATKYWIVSKPATEIASFGHYVTNARDVSTAGTGFISSIELDSDTLNRYKIIIDNYYETQNIGASIRHEIKVGDKLRFIRRRADAPGSNASQIAYLPYLELDIVDYDPAGGPGGRQVVFTNLFDVNLIENGFDLTEDQLFGMLIEIYTPRNSVDTTGNIFVSQWQDVTSAIPIINPHSNYRAHDAPARYYLSIEETSPGTFVFFIAGDSSSINGQSFPYVIYNIDGTTFSSNTVVTNAVYRARDNATQVSLTFAATGAMAYVVLRSGSAQVVDNNVSLSAANFSIGYGDVYVRQRDYRTGLDQGADIFYYFIEDFNYSDYWISDIHSTGRFRIEDPNAKMTHRQATAIHSASFIVGTQINGLSSFALDNTNIEDMNPVYGPVLRAYMSGREGKTLKCLQPKKENSIYIQFYPNEVGSDSTVRVSNRTFASWFDYRALYGCSTPGAVAVLPNGDSVYFDDINGVFILSGSNGQRVISEMDPGTSKDYKFRTKTRKLAKEFGDLALSDNIVPHEIRSYVNETMGEVGFAFKLGVSYEYNSTSIFIPATNQNNWKVQGEIDDYYSVVISQASGDYFGKIVEFDYDSITDETTITLDTPGSFVNDQAGLLITLDGIKYDHVVFDYVNDRWRSTYDYNFLTFSNLGQKLIGFAANNDLYEHNQISNTFHGENFIQKIKFVSNENPLAIKRYQDITQMSTNVFDVLAYSEPNQSYPLGMRTQMASNFINVYEGFSKVNYRKNIYDARFFSTGTSCTATYVSDVDRIGWLFPGDFSSLGLPGNADTNITIIQNNGIIFTSTVESAVYDSVTDLTTVFLNNIFPSSLSNGFWYYSDRAMMNGEDMRAYSLTHELSIDPPSSKQVVLFGVGIKGVLS